jgi:hypothetical protein
MQAELPLERGNTINGEAMCDVEDCGLVAAVIDDEETTYCRNHVRAAKGQIKELHPERCETPKQAEQRLLSEALDGKGPAYAAAYAKSQDENAGAPIGEPGGPPAVMEVNLEEESRDVAGFINGRNKGGKKKRAPERSAAPEPEQEQPTDDQKVLREALDGQPFPEPEPVEIPLEAIDEYQDMIRRFNIDVLAGDAEKAEAIQEAARSYMEGLQGGPGIMAPDGVGKRLEDATAAPEGEIPIWGQSGNFVVYVPAPGGGCKVRIDLAGMRGVGPFPSFGAHVVDKDKAFISRTGFRSFMGGSIEQRDVITFVVAQIEALIKSDKQLRKGLVMVEPVESEGKKRERRERKGKES